MCFQRFSAQGSLVQLVQREFSVTHRYVPWGTVIRLSIVFKNTITYTTLMIVIFGFFSREKQEFEHSRYCNACGRETRFTAVRRKHYASLFFIPVPLGSGKSYDVCNVCGNRYSDVPYGTM